MPGKERVRLKVNCDHESDSTLTMSHLLGRAGGKVGGNKKMN